MVLALCRRLAVRRALNWVKVRRCASLRQRGAVLVEAAIALPTVTLLVLGILEYGLLFGDGLNLTSSIRAASRTGAAMPADATTTDYMILQQIKTSSGRISGEIQEVVIYNAGATNGAPPQSCKNGFASTVLQCNVYTQADLNMSAAELASSGHSGFWPPDTRIPGTDYLGVWAKMDHHWITGIMGSGRTVADNAAMRVQPTPSSGSDDDSGYWVLLPSSTIAPTTTTDAASPTTSGGGKHTTTTGGGGGPSPTLPPGKGF